MTQPPVLAPVKQRLCTKNAFFLLLPLLFLLISSSVLKRHSGVTFPTSAELHDSQKKQRVPPLTYSPSLWHVVCLYLDTWLILTLYIGYLIWKRIFWLNLNELEFLSVLLLQAASFEHFSKKHPNSTVCDELIIVSCHWSIMHFLIGLRVWNRGFLKGISLWLEQLHALWQLWRAVHRVLHVFVSVSETDRPLQWTLMVSSPTVRL